jgi:hypothetical protein
MISSASEGILSAATLHDTAEKAHKAGIIAEYPAFIVSL